MVESKLWDEYLDRARDFIADGRLDAEEVSYKIAIGRDLAEARSAVFSGDTRWIVPVRKALRTNLGSFRQHVVLLNWFNEQSSDALGAMRAIWSQDSKPVDERIRAFLAMVPEHPTKFRGTGTRLREVSILLMALGPEQYPPFKVTEFNGAYRAVGYPRPPNDADEAEVYRHALGFLDELVAEAGARGFTRPSNRLEAQSVVWKNEFHPDPPPIDSTNITGLAEDNAPATRAVISWNFSPKPNCSSPRRFPGEHRSAARRQEAGHLSGAAGHWEDFRRAGARRAPCRAKRAASRWCSYIPPTPTRTSCRASGPP